MEHYFTQHYITRLIGVRRCAYRPAVCCSWTVVRDMSYRRCRSHIESRDMMIAFGLRHADEALALGCPTTTTPTPHDSYVAEVLIGEHGSRHPSWCYTTGEGIASAGLYRRSGKSCYRRAEKCSSCSSESIRSLRVHLEGNSPSLNLSWRLLPPETPSTS